MGCSVAEVAEVVNEVSPLIVHTSTNLKPDINTVVTQPVVPRRKYESTAHGGSGGMYLKWGAGTKPLVRGLGG